MSDDELKARAAEIRTEIARLETFKRQLDGVLGEVDHQARRSRDGLERLGGRSPELEQNLTLLARNRKLHLSDQARNQTALRALRDELARIEERMARARRN